LRSLGFGVFGYPGRERERERERGGGGYCYRGSYYGGLLQGVCGSARIVGYKIAHKASHVFLAGTKRRGHKGSSNAKVYTTMVRGDRLALTDVDMAPGPLPPHVARTWQGLTVNP
jgi:hypothetical protein